jgi:hypothetical protein
MAMDSFNFPPGDVASALNHRNKFKPLEGG